MRLFIYKILVNRHIEKAAYYRKEAFLYSAIEEHKLADKNFKKASFHNKKLQKYLTKLEQMGKENKQ